MIKFSEYKYEELDFPKITEEAKQLIERFKNSSTAEEQILALKEIDKFNIKVQTSFSLASIRFTQNVHDEYYTKQREIISEEGPKLQAVTNELNKAIVDSKFKEELTKEFGPRLVLGAEVALKTFSEEIIPDMVEDNKLDMEYSKIIAGAKINFRGEVLNLPKLGKYMSDADRETRKEASEAYFNYYAEHLNELDTIYDKMVKCRTSMAKKLGFKNYVELGYLNLGRTDYNADDVKKYRDMVYKYVVPVTNALFTRQAERLHINDMMYYDYNLEFLSGNAKPIGTPNELIEKAAKMYKEMSKETDEFFTFMRESELLDLVARDGKESGGYTSSIPAYKAPFIFSNFNGTSGDVDVLTHEAGHAFMCYRCREPKLMDLQWPTLEACEIHSMSMEFFAYPWMESFFENQTDKYKFSHLSGCVTFLPYGVAVDEFQTEVYENPEMTPEQRRATWKRIEEKYLPHLKYGNNKFLNDGGRWMRQSHIFGSPFYYIDYTIAQVCAFQFFNASQVNYKEAWDRYVNLCNLGGNDTFLNLLKNENVKLQSPFEEGCIENTIKPIQEFLDKFDDKNM